MRAVDNTNISIATVTPSIGPVAPGVILSVQQVLYTQLGPPGANGPT